MVDNVSLWCGKKLTSELVAFEIYPAQNATAQEVPTPLFAVVCASDTSDLRQDKSCLILPGQMANFVVTHSHCHWLCHGAEQLHLILESYFQQHDSQEALDSLWQLPREHRFHDVGVIHQLWQYASGGDIIARASLSEVAAEYCSIEDLEDKETLTEHYLASQGGNVRAGEVCIHGAIRRAKVLVDAFTSLKENILRLAEENGLEPDLVTRFGLLGSGWDVQGAIALERARINGIRLDRDGRDNLLSACERTWDHHASLLQGAERTKHLLKMDNGEIRCSSTGFPQYKEDKLREWLRETARITLDVWGHPLPHPVLDEQSNHKVSNLATIWSLAGKANRLLYSWQQLDATSRVRHTLRNVGGTEDQRIHPLYQVLPCIRSTRPDLEQVLTLTSSVFCPAPSQSFLVVKIPNLLLRCLASHCERRFGASRLAELFRDGSDPVLCAAATLCGVSVEEMVHQRATHPEASARWTNLASGMLYALPTGMSNAGIRECLRNEYDLEVTESEVANWRHLLANMLYPELGQHLSPSTGWEVVITTHTGRIHRTGSSVTVCCARYFDLADAALKAAIFNVSRHYRLVGVSGEELVLEIPADIDRANVELDVQRTLQEAVTEILNNVPVRCDCEWRERW